MKAAVGLMGAFRCPYCATEFCPNMATSTENTGKSFIYVRHKTWFSLYRSLRTSRRHNGLTCLLPVTKFAQIGGDSTSLTPLFNLRLSLNRCSRSSRKPCSFCEQYLTDFHENPTDSLVADTRLRTDGTVST